MMLTMLLSGLIGFAAILATVAMFATWMEHASAWDAVEAEMRSGKRVPVRHVTVRVVNFDRGAGLMHAAHGRGPEVRTYASVTRLGLRAAA
jgi:hypothetical protein